MVSRDTIDGKESTDCTQRAASVRRRTFLGSVAGGLALGASGVAAAGGDGPGTGFPPPDITTWGRTVNLGDGTARTFTSVTPAGEPRYHGVVLTRDALAGLPSAADLENAGDDAYTDKYGANGEALVVHGKWSQEFFVPFPATDATPFTFLGLNWNPGGHPPPGVYTVPHFDVHFHTLAPGTVDAITGPRPAGFELPGERIPAGYSRAPSPETGTPLVITDMGEHLVDFSAPEFSGGEFANTLIWGAFDVDGDGTGELTFVEPMVTRASLRDLGGLDRRAIPQPETFAREGPYPTAYSVRDLPDRDALAITIEAFDPGGSAARK